MRNEDSKHGTSERSERRSGGSNPVPRILASSNTRAAESPADSEPCKERAANRCERAFLASVRIRSRAVILQTQAIASTASTDLILTEQESRLPLMRSVHVVSNEGLTMSVYDPLRDSSVRPAESTRVDCAVDDADNPTELTVFSDQDDELPTHWISVDIEHAVALDEMR